MNNATALIEGLAGERVRSTEGSKTFDEQIRRLVGDEQILRLVGAVLLCTGFLSYCGPFRSNILRIWKKAMKYPVRLRPKVHSAMAPPEPVQSECPKQTWQVTLRPKKNVVCLRLPDPT
jgi:hypothetical protein